MKIILLSLLFVFGLTSAQTHRFIYELKIYKNDDVIKTNMALDIDKNFVKFYDYEFVRRDSIRKSGKNSQYFSESDQMLLRKPNSFDNKIFFSHGYDYFVIKSTDKIDWKLEKETKKVLDYTLQKATANFGGRI